MKLIYNDLKHIKKREIGKRYYRKNKDIILQRNKIYIKNNRERMQKYFREYSKKWRQDHPKEAKEIAKRSYSKHREKRLKHSENNRMKLRLKVLELIGGNKIECFNCGQKDIRLLNINHLNGEGSKDVKKYKGSVMFLYAIINGIRKIDDLNILCRICNQAHFVKLKYGIEYEIRPKISNKIRR